MTFKGKETVMYEKIALASKSDLRRTQQILLHGFTSGPSIYARNVSPTLCSRPSWPCCLLCPLCECPAILLPMKIMYPFCRNYPAPLLFNNGEGKD